GAGHREFTCSPSVRHAIVTGPTDCRVIIDGVRILFVSESFLPHMNGVTGSVLRVADHFAATGDDLGVIAPAWPGAEKSVRTSCGRRVRVHRIASAPMPGYSDVRIAATSAAKLRRRIDEFAPDVIHLASPMLLGGRAAVAAQKAGVPTVAVYQTDIPGFTARDGMPFLESASWQLLRDAHNRATLNLAPAHAPPPQSAPPGTSCAPPTPGPPSTAPPRTPPATRCSSTASSAWTCGGAAWTPPCSRPRCAAGHCAPPTRGPRRSSWSTWAGSRPRSRSRTWRSSTTCPAYDCSSWATGPS